VQIDLDAKMLKAKIELMTKSAFLSTISLSIRQMMSEEQATAWTNERWIKYNPNFIKPLSVAELAGLIAHECWHIAFQHLSRRGDRDPRVWNAAGDYVINWLLIKAGFQIPHGGLIDPRFEGMSTDEVYNILIAEGFEPPGGNIWDILGEPGTAEEQDAVRDILVRAQMQAQTAGEAGTIPGEVTRIIDKLVNPRLPWPVLLNRFLDARIQEEYSWNRKSRRYRPFMPSMQSYGLGHLTWAIDTSGSQNDEDLRADLSEIKGVRDVLRPEKMTIIDCDAVIHNVWDVDQNTDIMSLKFTGNGGTKFQPVLDYVEEHPTQALVYFTDLYGEQNLKPVDYPVLWICNSGHAPAPFGQTIYID
jgi:predicted metal-dependent peptidase